MSVDSHSLDRELFHWIIFTRVRCSGSPENCCHGHWLTCSIFGSRNPHWNIHSWQMTTPLMIWPHASECQCTNQSPTVISSPCWVMIAQLMDWLCPRRDANGQLYGRQHLEPAVIDSRQGPKIENQILRVKSNVNVNCIGVFCFWNWHWTFSTYIAL